MTNVNETLDNVAVGIVVNNTFEAPASTVVDLLMVASERNLVTPAYRFVDARYNVFVGAATALERVFNDCLKWTSACPVGQVRTDWPAVPAS